MNEHWINRWKILSRKSHSITDRFFSLYISKYIFFFDLIKLLYKNISQREKIEEEETQAFIEVFQRHKNKEKEREKRIILSSICFSFTIN